MQLTDNHVLIRSANNNDIKNILEISVECKLEHWTLINYQQELKRDESLILVALKIEEIEKVIGFIVARFSGKIHSTDNNSNIKGYSESDIINLGVSVKYQKQSIGTKLLNEFLNRVREIQVESIWLEVREINIDAIKFYKKNGFLRVQTRRNFYTNPLDNAIVMKLEMPNPERIFNERKT